MTASTVVDVDLTGCPGDGLVIGRDNVTLDLRGHRLEGTGASGSAGIRIEGHRGVKVVDTSGEEDFDKRVWGFGTGVLIDHADRTRVVGLNLFENVGDGIRVVRSSHVRLERNQASSNGRNGIALVDADDNVVEVNDAHGNDPNAPGLRPGIGVRSGNGIALFGSEDNEIRGNEVVNNNVFGIALFDSDDNDVVGNQAGWIGSDGNERGGIAFFDSDDALIARNETGDNAGDGIFVDGDSARSTIERNVSANNRDDGIDVDATSAVLARNDADDNDDLGIEASRKVTDRGRNVASDNGDPRQCTGVRCGAG